MEKSSFRRIFNLDISGNTSSQLLDRVESEFTSRWNSNKSSIVIISVGSNDIAKDKQTGKYKADIRSYKKNITKIINRFHGINSGRGSVLLCSITPLNEQRSKVPDSRGFTRIQEDVDLYNDTLRVIASKFEHVQYIDISKILIQKKILIKKMACIQ